jgi:hypothetical protein
MTLVTKLRFVTDEPKLCFEECVREAELPYVRSQAELGNEILVI